MATRFSISDIRTDDDLLASRKTARVGTSGDIKFETPLKVGIGDLKNKCSINEIYKMPELATLDKWIIDSRQDNKYSKSLANERSLNAFNILSLAYNNKEQIPNEDQIRVIADMQYLNSDAVVTPSWFDIIKSEDKVDVDLYLQLSKSYLEYASFRNNKPILGTIPMNIPSNYLSKVIGFYMDCDVTSFIIDCNARSVLNSTWTRNFQRELNEYKVEKECLTYITNAYQGAVKKNEDTCEAQDFLNFAMGYDIIGDKHIAKRSSNFYESGTIQGKSFDKNTYRYVKVPCKSDKERSNIKMVTIDTQINEMGVIRETINEGDSLKNNLQNKAIDEITIKKMAEIKVHQNIRQSGLGDYFN